MRASGKTFWTTSKKSVSAEKNLSLILGSVTRLPLKYWQNSFFFTGAGDHELLTHTAGEFPKTTINGKTHPIFSLSPLPNNAGFRVCPCSSSRPFFSRIYRWIKKGCRLEYTGHRMDKNSHLIDTIWFNVPGAMAGKVRFRGKVPAACIVTAERADRRDSVKMKGSANDACAG